MDSDGSINPPIRLRVVSSTSSTTKSTQLRLENFLRDFQHRTTAGQEGNTAVTVQLKKLKDALQAERQWKATQKQWYVASFEPFILILMVPINRVVV